LKSYKCRNCCYGKGVVLTPETSIETDLYGMKKLVTKYYKNCPNGQDIDYTLSNNEFKYLIAFADDSDEAKDPIAADWFYTFTDNYTDCSRIKDYYTFDTIDELEEFWKEMHKNPLGMWYFMVHNKKGQLYTFCSGAVDPDDIESIKGYRALI
jgi:hypothetical protein